MTRAAAPARLWPDRAARWQCAGAPLPVMRRTVITGLGAVTPVGNDMSSTWDALIAGKSGVGRIERFDPDTVGLKFPLAAEVQDFSPQEMLPDAKTLRHMDRNVQYGLASALEAIEDSGLEVDADNRHRVGVIFGSGGGGMQLVIHWDEVMKTRGARGASRHSRCRI